MGLSFMNLISHIKVELDKSESDRDALRAVAGLIGKSICIQIDADSIPHSIPASDISNSQTSHFCEIVQVRFWRITTNNSFEITLFVKVNNGKDEKDEIIEKVKYKSSTTHYTTLYYLSGKVCVHRGDSCRIFI